MTTIGLFADGDADGNYPEIDGPLDRKILSQGHCHHPHHVQSQDLLQVGACRCHNARARHYL